jgi:tetratricopeptide (TPR) repeat protein
MPDTAKLDAENLETYEDLLVTIEASKGVLSLLIAVCDNSQFREELIARLQAELQPEIRCYRLSLIRGEPSLKMTILQKMQTDDYLREGGRSVVMVTGAEQLYFLQLGEEKSEQDAFFGYLQWTREALPEFRFPIVLWVTTQLLTQMERKAPDFWGWRKGVFRFKSRQTAAVKSSQLKSFQPILAELGLANNDDILLPLADLQALVAQTEQKHPDDPLLATLYSQMGRLYAGRAKRGETIDYRQEQETAIDYFCKAIERQGAIGQEENLANSLDWLASLYDSQGRYSEAEPLLLQALDIWQRQLGDDHPCVATSLNNLAYLYNSQGRYSEAEPLFLQSLAIRQRQLGDDHLSVATSLNNLANLYDSQGRYSEAEPLYLQALEIRQRQLGDDHPDVATSLNNLANLYDSQGRYSEAEPLLLQALEIRQRQLGDDHPDVATSLNNLAGLYNSQGRYSEAEPLYLQALAIWQRRLGDDHPNVATSLNNVAGLYRFQGRYSEAEPLYLQSLAIRQRQLGDDHPNVAQSLNNLAALYESQGRYSEAEPLYSRALEVLEKMLGANHPNTQIVQKILRCFAKK